MRVARVASLAALVVAAAAIMWSVGWPRAAYSAMEKGLALDADREQRELLPGRPLVRAMFRVRQSDDALDPLQPIVVGATQAASLLADGATGSQARSFCPPAGASSIGYCSRGPPRAGAQPSLLERA